MSNTEKDTNLGQTDYINQPLKKNLKTEEPFLNYNNIEKKEDNSRAMDGVLFLIIILVVYIVYKIKKSENSSSRKKRNLKKFENKEEDNKSYDNDYINRTFYNGDNLRLRFDELRDLEGGYQNAAWKSKKDKIWGVKCC